MSEFMVIKNFQLGVPERPARYSPVVHLITGRWGVGFFRGERCIRDFCEIDAIAACKALNEREQLEARIHELETELAKRPLWCEPCNGDGFVETHEGAMTHRCDACGGCGMVRPR